MGGITNETVHLSFAADWSKEVNPLLPNKYGARKLSLPVRVLSVADVFTALAEHRPYRAAMDISTVLQLLIKMAKEFYLDRNIVSIVVENAQFINSIRLNAQQAAASNFIAMRQLCLNF